MKPRTKPNRREVIAGGLAACMLPGFPRTAAALSNNPSGEKLHGLSAFGDLKYPADFTHFDYASPDAPKGGRFRFLPSNWIFNQNVITFNTFNSFVLKGEAPPRMEMCFDTLMTASMDEPDAIYCALAESIEISADGNSYRFVLRSEARFHDGSPVTADDVVFSCETLKSHGHPQLALALKELQEAVRISEKEVELKFNGKQSDRAILFIAPIMPIFSKDWFGGRKFTEVTDEPILGSGPNKVGKFDLGKYIEYEKVADYWARDLPFARGLNHFQTLRIDFFRDRVGGFEAFKKGEIDFREEFFARNWAKDYDFPAVIDGRVKKELVKAEKYPSMQAWALNSRKRYLEDVRTREAIALCFDYEWTNKNLFYGAYTRAQSVFEKSEFKATGKPDEKELELLKLWKDDISELAFGEALIQPVTDGSGNNRDQLRRASELLKEAGWRPEAHRLVNKDGYPLAVEFLIDSKSLETLHGKFVENLKSIGVKASIRLVDSAQYQKRLETYDYDAIMYAANFHPTPTMESLKQSFFSEYADEPGGRNYPSIKSKAIDGLLEKAGEAKTREELTTVLRVLDRVLRPMYLWIPNWYSANHRLAYWDIYGRSDVKPDYDFRAEQLWWSDEEKAKAINKG